MSIPSWVIRIPRVEAYGSMPLYYSEMVPHRIYYSKVKYKVYVDLYSASS